MSNKLLFRMVVLMAAMMCALGASAKEAYACYTSENKTFTFYYEAPVPKRPMLATRLRTRRSLFTTTTSAAVARTTPSYCKTSQAIYPRGLWRFFL